MIFNLDQLLRGYPLREILVELAIIWICVYGVIRFLRGTRGAGVIKGVAVVMVVGTLVLRVLSQDSTAFAQINFIYDRFLGVLTIALIVVFQPELRQAMVRLGQTRWFGAATSRYGSVVDAVSGAVDLLSKSQFGAVIAIERQGKLGGLVAGGEELDAKVSARLLSTIFWPNSPLHDLGVVIRGDRIVAANVQFPLAEDTALPQNFGSRHRAALGLTLESDCIVVVVSEETGRISIAQHGHIESGIDRDAFAEELARRLRTDPNEDESEAENTGQPYVADAAPGEEAADATEIARHPAAMRIPSDDDDAAASKEPVAKEAS